MPRLRCAFGDEVILHLQYDLNTRIYGPGVSDGDQAKAMTPPALTLIGRDGTCRI